MTEKHVKVMVHGADRDLWHSGEFKVTVRDLFAKEELGRPKKSSANALSLALQLPFDAGQLYGVTLAAKKHRTAFTFVRQRDFIQPRDDIETDTFMTSLMLVPDNPVSSTLDAGHEKLQALGSPLVAPGVGIKAEEFQQLDPAMKMALLNIEAKLRMTFVEGRPLLSFVAGVRHVVVDRLFLFMDPRAKDAVRLSPDFADAPGHGAPEGLPGTPSHPDSFKHTRFGEGNIQLSFSERTEPFVNGGGAPCHSVDVDIDLARGLGHVVEFLENNVFKPGKTTDQTLVYALLFNQNIKPSYTLDLIRSPARSTRARRARAGRTRGRRARSKPS
jgi:hypothetical protein